MGERTEAMQTLHLPEYISTAILFMMLALFINELLLSFLASFQKKHPGYLSWLLPTTFTTFIGVIAGGFLHVVDTEYSREVLNSAQAGFSDIFLVALLPPIIFDSAIKIKI